MKVQHRQRLEITLDIFRGCKHHCSGCMIDRSLGGDVDDIAGFDPLTRELRPAVAPEAVEDISRQTLGVDTEQRRELAMDVAHRQDYGFFNSIAGTAFKPENAEQSVLGRKVSFSGLGQSKTCGILHE